MSPYKGEALTCTSRHNRNWEEIPLEETYMQMERTGCILSLPVKRSAGSCQRGFEKNNMTAEEIDYFILHQANKRIVEAVAKRLDVSIDKFPMNLQEYGNTSSASIPILLDEMSRDGRLKKGQKIILAGFGAGLSGGQLSWNGINNRMKQENTTVLQQ